MLARLLKLPVNGQRGGALVEFAIIAPVLFVFLIGSLEFGFLIYEYHATDYAAKSAARWASVRGANCSDSSCPATATTIKSFVTSSVPGLQTSDASFAVTPTWSVANTASYPQAIPTPSACAQATANKGCLVTVTVTNPVTIQIPFITIHSFTLTSSSSAVVQ